MKKYFTEKLLINLVFLLFVSLEGCGFVSDKPPANAEVYYTPSLQTCKIDTDKLGDIFQSDQEDQIRCLQQNFVQFIKYVPTEESEIISENELSIFVKKFFPQDSESILKGLSVIFQLDMIFLHDEAHKISRKNIEPLFNLLVRVNKEAVVITQIVKELEEGSKPDHFWELREKLNLSVSRFKEEAINLIENSPGPEQKLNIKDFILDISKKLESKEANPVTIDSLLFIKKLLVDGDKSVITSDELKLLIKKLPHMLTTSFDLVYAKKTNFKSDYEFGRFYLSDVREIYNIFNFEQKDFELLTIDQVLHFAETFKLHKDVKKFKPSLVALKSKLVGGSESSITLSDAKVLLDIFHDMNEKTYFSEVTYTAYQDLLLKNEAILHLQQLDLPDQYDFFKVDRVTALHHDFEQSAINIRYFANEKDGIPYYGNEILRDKQGFSQSTLLTWLSVKILKAYGHINADGSSGISISEFQVFLNDIKPILVELRMWSSKPTMAQNGIMLADIFQNRSNGDLDVNLIEATEYVQMILSAAKVSDRFSSELSLVCDPGIDREDPVFQTECWNEHFFETFLNQADLKIFFPNLSKYVEDNTKVIADEYIKGIEGYARDNPDPLIPINRRESRLIFGAMINIESTFNRIDLNGDNTLDYDELLKTFPIYKKTIVTMAKLKPKKEKYAQSIFLYMVSKMKVPPVKTIPEAIKFFAYHKCVSNKRCRNGFIKKFEAERLNIAKVQYYLANPSALMEMDFDLIPDDAI